MSVQAKKAYRESIGIAPLILSLRTRWRWSEDCVGRTAWPDVLKQTISCPPAGNLIPDRPRRILVTTLTELRRLCEV